MNEYMEPTPVKHKKKFFTPITIVLSLLVVNALVFLMGRFLFGIGAVTNLNDQYPWGIWIGLDVAAGVALAAGGFTTAALGHVMHRRFYETILRPALLTAMLGYTFVALSVSIDIGRWYYIWHPLIYWNGSSPLFEVGICVMLYLIVLYIEFIPVVTERFAGKVNFKSIFAVINKPLNKLLKALDKGLGKVMFLFVIAGVVLSCLHQSSLGTLMVIAGEKMHPLWQTPILPLLFLISAISVGFPMVIFESTIASRTFGLKPETEVLTRLGRIMGPILGIYLAFKIGDIVVRDAFVHLTEFTVPSVMFAIELIMGVIIPLRMFFSNAILHSKTGLFIASSLVIFGVLLNRFNNFIIAYHPPYSFEAYIPSIGEISVTVGFVAFEILLYKFLSMYLPVLSLPKGKISAKTKYAIKGTAK